MFSFNPWEILTSFEIGYYTILLLVAIFPTFKLVKHGSSFKWFFLRYHILLLTKIIGGALTVAFIKSSSHPIGLGVGSSVLSVVGSGIIVTSLVHIIKFADTYGEPKESKTSKKSLISNLSLIANIRNKEGGENKVQWDKLIDKLTLATIIVNAVGSSYIGSNRALAKKLMEAGSILYILVLIGILVLIKISYTKCQESSASRQVKSFKKTLLSTAVTIMPFMFVRMIYNICNAFTLNVNGTYTQNVSKFTFLFGKWEYFTFMAFLEECIVIMLFTLVSFLVLKHEHFTHFEDGVEEKNLEYEESSKSVGV